MRSASASLPVLTVMTALIALGSAAATPPCPAFDYRVVYQDSVCSAVILRDAGLALQNLFIRDFPTGNYTSLGDLVRPAPTEAERTTFLDANADGLASASDAFQTWAPGGCTNGELTIYTGSNASNIGGSQGFSSAKDSSRIAWAPGRIRTERGSSWDSGRRDSPRPE